MALRKFNMKDDRGREVSVASYDHFFDNISVYIKNPSNGVEVGLILKRNELEELITGLMDIGDFTIDDLKGDVYRYKVPEIFESDEKKNIYLYQNMETGKIFFKGSKSGTLLLDDEDSIYKSKFTRREMELMIKSNPELNVLKEVDINKY